ncbi:hypothetical protein Ga0061079_1096 [Apibacter mensalis]|uniref:Uncharacterized protein n=1 Tax=Apibacter mensalis TaxID=1586267 RepID=A0A0X3AR75_9FLAO|nr:hypothetical protein [Apibacter mensalis]CVK16617.1 hypothetical protein Ga0061079_1096 [Apibacter mensalis]
MLRIKVGGTLRRTANGEIRNYAKGDIIDSAKEVITQARDILFGKAIPHPEREIPLSLACIEFLPGEGPNPLSPSTTGEAKKMKYQGQFGFDFFRKKNSVYTDEKSFFDSLPLDTQTGYFSENGVFKQYKTAKEQYEALCKEYKKHPITYRPKKEIKDGWESEEWLYYIPYLTLYSKEYVESLTSEYKPVYEAYLSLSVEIEKDIDQWKFEYDTSLFKHSLEIPLETKKCQPTKHGCNLKITCLKDFDREQEIRVYAYPKGSKGKHELEQESMKELAGVIKVLPNSANYRKKVNVLAVQLQTDVNDTNGKEVQRGKFYKDQIQRFHHLFNQAYIEPELEFYKTKDGEKFLDLTKDPRFKKNTSYIDGEGNIIWKYNNTLRNSGEKYLESFLPEDKKGHLIIYIFNLKCKKDEETDILGDSVLNSKRCFIYQDLTFKDNLPFFHAHANTPVHEAMHGLGLAHTFYSDSYKNHGKYAKFFLNQGSTGNLMDYSRDAYFLYKWQWDLIRQEI